MRSETDTEVAAHLIEVEVAKGADLTEAMQRVCRRLEGAFTLVAVASADPTRVVAARRNSPLVVGLGEGENFLASDVAAFIDHTREAMELGQDQVVTITRDDVRSPTSTAARPRAGGSTSTGTSPRPRRPATTTSCSRRSPSSRRRSPTPCSAGSADTGRLQLDEMRLSDEELRAIDKIIIIACGTAFHAGLVAKYAIEHWTRIPCEVELASEFRYRDPIIDRDTMVIAISQSGETMDTLMALRHAREQRAKVLAISNTNGSTIPRESDAVLYTHAGPEIAVASTKAFLTQIVACHLIALYLAQVRGTKYGDEITEIMGQLERMPDAVARRCWRPSSRSGQLARELRDAKSVLFLGRHVGYPVALEGALKLKELAYMHAEGFAAGELKHGPIALIEEGMPVFVVVPPKGRGLLHDKMVSNIQEVRARGARTIVLAEEGDEAVVPYADELIRAAEGADPVAAAGGDRAAAGVLVRDGDGARPRRRPAAQPGQVGHGRVAARGRGRQMIVGVGIDVVDIERFAETLERTPAMRDRLFTALELERAARVAGGPVRGQGGAGEGARARRADCTGSTPRCGPTPAGKPSLRMSGTVADRAAELGVAHTHVSLSHDAGIASAVVVLEG